MGALAVMTVLSAALGWAAPNLVRGAAGSAPSRHQHVVAELTCVLCAQISKTYTHYAAVALFFFFGLKSLYDAFLKKDDVSACQARVSQTTPSRCPPLPLQAHQQPHYPTETLPCLPIRCS